jgi:uncharacterized protein YjbI with pentapeptide repeats
MRPFLKIRLASLVAITFLAVSILSPYPSFIISSARAACTDTAAPSVNWENCRKRNLIMDNFNFSGSNFTRADLSASDLRNSNFQKAIFFKTNLARASLAGSDAEGANFEGVVASRTDFSNGNYKNTNFLKAEIGRSNFSNSNLENANMSKADFSRVNFFNSNLKGVNLAFSNISRANFTSINIDENFSLEGAYMFLTRIEGLDLSASKSLKQWQINMACGNEKTILPEGLSAPDTWPCDFETDS